jgi:hypothetical protein
VAMVLRAFPELCTPANPKPWALQG